MDFKAVLPNINMKIQICPYYGKRMFSIHNLFGTELLHSDSLRRQEPYKVLG